MSALDFWIEAAVYNAGDKVKHTINDVTYGFEAKHWTQGVAPLLTKQYGGTVEEWETEWSMLNDGEPLPDIGEPEPPIKPEPPVDPELPDPPVDPELPDPPVEPEVTFDAWQADKIYVEGDRVTHVINGKSYNFQAKYWVQGTAPFLTESHGGTGADWDTPWQILTGSEGGNGDGNGG